MSSSDHGKRGRKPGESYKRRTDVQIARDNTRKREEEDAAAAERAAKRLRFFEPTVAAAPPAANAAPQLHPDLNTTTVPEPPMPQRPQQQPLLSDESDDVPYNLDVVPLLFRKSVREAAEEIRQWSKKHSQSWNQHSKRDFNSQGFPWKKLEKEWPCPNLLQRNVTLVDFLLPFFARVKMCLPDRITGHHLRNGRMPCKWHKYDEDCVIRDAVFTPQGPRVSFDADGSVTYNFASRFCCKINRDAARKSKSTNEDEEMDDQHDNHPYYFVGHCPEVIAQLPPNIRSSFGIVITKKRAFSTKLVNHIIDQAASKVSFLTMRANLVSAQKRHLYESQRSFYGVYANPVMTGKIYGSADPSNSDLTLDMVVPYSFPSRQYIQQAFVSRILDLLPLFERNLAMTGGSILRADKSYKVVRFIYIANAVEGKTAGQQSTKAYDSVYTVMNEYGQIVAIHFIRGGDFEEMERILKEIKNRYQVHGFEDVELFYTDDCCHEYNMLTRAFPELATGDWSTTGNNDRPVSFCTMLPLPEQWPRTTITSYAQLQDFCIRLGEFIDACDDDFVLLGLDAEWDSLTLDDRQAQKPVTLQLATSSGDFICVIQLVPTFEKVVSDKSSARHGALRMVLAHEKVKLCGVGVKGDIHKLYKHWPPELFGERLDLDTKCYDPNVVARKLHLISGPKVGQLKHMLERFVGHTIDKKLARSKWSALQLSRDLIEYAARDALASARLASAIVLLQRKYRSPTRNDLTPNIPIRLLAENCNEIVAYGRFHSIEESEEIVPAARNSRSSGPAFQPRKYTRFLVSIIRIVKKSAYIPGTGRRQTLDGCDISVPIAWPIKSLQLSMEEELTFHEQQATAAIPPADPPVVPVAGGTVERNNRSDIARRGTHVNSHPETPQVETPQVETVLEEIDESDDDNNIEVLLPDGTTLEDYPEQHVPDLDDDENDFVVVVDGDHVHAAQHTQEFERNSVKRDPFHAQFAYKRTLKKGHGIYETFSGLLRDAFLQADKVAIEKERAELSDRLFDNNKSSCYQDRERSDKESRRRLYCPSSKLLAGIARQAPDPAVLEKNLCDAVNLCANVRDARTGEMFFSRETWKVHKQMLLHVRLGCLSDKPGINYYYTTSPGLSGKTVLWCVRGTSQLEGFHKHLRHIFPGFHTSSLLATCLLALFVYRWNIDRAVERGLLSEEYGNFYNHEIIHDTQVLSRSVVNSGHSPIHGSLKNCNDFAATGEKFYTPIVKAMSILSSGNTVEDLDLSPDMEFTAEREGSFSLPIVPVLDCEQPAILEMIVKFTGRAGPRSANQRTSCDYESTAVEWNHQCAAELEKPAGERRKMYPKQASHIRTFHEAFKRGENARKTQRQAVMVVDQANGLSETHVVSRAIRDLRERLQEESQEVRAPVPLEAAAAPIPNRAEGEAVDPVILPPEEVSRARRNEAVMETVRRQEHLIAPAAQLLVTNGSKKTRYRCLRCGKAKSGLLHDGGVSSTLQSYCNVPRNQYQKGWVIAPGYGVNDQRKKGNLRSFKREWRRRKESQNLVDEEHFDNWS
jgi:hypothetical protein